MAARNRYSSSVQTYTDNDGDDADNDEEIDTVIKCLNPGVSAVFMVRTTLILTMTPLVSKMFIHPSLLSPRHYPGKRVNPSMIGLIPEVIPLKLFLDLESSSFEGDIRATHGQPKRLSPYCLKQNGGKLSKTFHTTDVFCIPSHLFVQWAFVCFALVSLLISLPCIQPVY